MFTNNIFTNKSLSNKKSFVLCRQTSSSVSKETYFSIDKPKQSANNNCWSKRELDNFNFSAISLFLFYLLSPMVSGDKLGLSKLSVWTLLCRSKRFFARSSCCFVKFVLKESTSGASEEIGFRKAGRHFEIWQFMCISTLFDRVRNPFWNIKLV